MEIMQKHGKTCFRSHIFYTTEYPEYSELARYLSISVNLHFVGNERFLPSDSIYGI